MKIKKFFDSENLVLLFHQISLNVIFFLLIVLDHVFDLLRHSSNLNCSFCGYMLADLGFLKFLTSI